MSVLRPKYSLDKAGIQGARATINAVPFTELTTRRYPYPRTGTRAPNSMFPHPSNPGHNPGLGHDLVRMPWGYMERGVTVKVGAMPPHYILNKTAVQGVMPASIYRRMTGKLTTEPTLPPARVGQRLTAPMEAPALVDWGSVFWGFVAGGTIALAMAYGILPALGAWGAKAIKARG